MSFFLIHLIRSLLSPSDAEAPENISMTLTELSMFMKKQELELQLRTEKERDEGEYLFQVAAQMSEDTLLEITSDKSGREPTGNIFHMLAKTMSDYLCKIVGCVRNKQIEVSLCLPVLFCLQPPSRRSC